MYCNVNYQNLETKVGKNSLNSLSSHRYWWLMSNGSFQQMSLKKIRILCWSLCKVSLLTFLRNWFSKSYLNQINGDWKHGIPLRRINWKLNTKGKKTPLKYKNWLNSNLLNSHSWLKYWWLMSNLLSFVDVFGVFSTNVIEKKIKTL